MDSSRKGDVRARMDWPQDNPALLEIAAREKEAVERLTGLFVLARPLEFNILRHSLGDIAGAITLHDMTLPEGMQLECIRLGGSCFTDVTLKNVNLLCAHMDACDLERVDLSGANLNGVDLRQTRLKEVRLDGAQVECVELEDARIDEFTYRNAPKEFREAWVRDNPQAGGQPTFIRSGADQWGSSYPSV